MTSSNDGVLSSLPPNSIAGLSLSIFADLLSNLTHDLVLQSHRQEKLLRARVQQQGDASSTLPSALSVMSPEVTCSRCHLPQHTTQTMLQADASDKKKFCTKLPFQNTPYHDIYGNLFPTISGSTSAREKKAAIAADSPTPDPSDTAAPTPKVSKNSGIVYLKCLSCDKDKVASLRFTAHLEKCLGLSGRKSSRTAMAKMNSSSGGGSPMLAPADAPGGGNGGAKQGGSRKPSPDKKSPAPPPVIPNGGAEVVKISASVLPSLPTGTGGVGGATISTPKKKKKKGAVGANVPVPVPPAAMPYDGGEALEERDRERELTSLAPPPKDLTAPPPKKRKRKSETEGTINVQAAPSAATVKNSAADADAPKPAVKKQKITPLPGTESPMATKKQLNKFNKNRQSPVPGSLPKKPVSASPAKVHIDRTSTAPPVSTTSAPKVSKPKSVKEKPGTGAGVGPGMGMAGKTAPRPVKKAAGGDGLPKKPKGPGKGKMGKLAGKGIGAGKGVGSGPGGSGPGGGEGGGSSGISNSGGSVAAKGIARKGVPQ